MTDQPVDPTRDARKNDEVPQILEVFGAEPLVHPSSSATQAPADDDRTTDAESEGELFDDETPATAVSEPNPEPTTSEPRAAAEDDGWQPSATDALPDEAESAETADTAPASDDDAQAGLLTLIEQRMGAIENTLEGLGKQSSFIPPKLRGLGKKVDELSSVLSDGRLRELLLELVGMLDMADLGLHAKAKKDDLRRTLAAVSTRLGQSMETNGLAPIDTSGVFDPARHHAIERRVVGDPALDGMIVEVFRRGWRDEHAVLRYADVAVGAYEEGAPTAPTAETPAQGDGEPQDDDALPLTPATLTPGNNGGRAAPRRSTTISSLDDEGVTDRTAAGTSPRDTENDNKDMDDV